MCRTGTCTAARPAASQTTYQGSMIFPVRDREPFKSIWRQLPSGERREVLRLALRGKPAPDSFKAWLVVEFTTSKLTPRTFIPVFLALSVDVIVGAFAWLANSRVAWVP